MRVQIIHHQHDLVGCWIVLIKDLPHHLGPIPLGAVLAHLGDPSAYQWLVSDKHVADALALDLRVPKLDCPLILFAGRHDINVNSQVAAEWFATVQAPSKQFVWFENSAHLPMTEEPGKFLVSLVRTARPIAERAGDAPPDTH